MNIRNKLILMLAVPLAALAVVGSLGFRSQSSTALEATDAIAQDEMIQSLNRLVKAIGGERLAVEQAGNSVFAPVIDRRIDTDAALAESRALAQQLELPAVQAELENTTTNMEIVRATFNLRRVKPITEALRAVRDDIEVVYPTQASFALATSVDIAVDIADRQDSIWIEYLDVPRVTTDLARRLRAETGATDLLREQLTEIAPEGQQALITETLAGRDEFNMRRLGIDAVNQFDREDPKLLDGPTLTILTTSHNDWHDHAIDLQGDLVLSLEALSEDAKSSQNLFALLATLGLFVLFSLIYVVYRSVVKPLEQLLSGAEKVANDHLPSVVAELRTIGSSDENVRIEPLARESNDEFGLLVDAFNDVQLTAFDLAVEQARSRRNTAEMFVNLGRRNQKLLQRMLSTISGLEQDEKNPERLEQLFELDHMTTRMRRNAESLLVVAGTTSPRQWAKPVPAAEVVRSALAEVKDYHRVDILSLADAPVAGNAVADITHLLAELLENSLQFSEPGTQVNISSRWTDGNYRIVINDQGFGMTPSELAEHNSLIADPPPADQAPTRFLGLFVVGHLAKRHGISVVLTDATIGGTDARITLPGSLMSEAAGSASGAETQLPVRELDEGLDLDAELAQLTAEADMNRNGEGLPVRADALADASPAEVAPTEGMELPVRGDVIQTDAAPAEVAHSEVAQAEVAQAEVAHAEVAELPVRGEVAPAPEVGDLPVRTNAFQAHADAAPAPTAIDFGQVPELPRFDAPVQSSVDQLPAPPAPPAAPVAEIAPAAPAAPPAPAAPAVAAPAAAAPQTADLGTMGLPQRTPRATLQDASTLPSTGAMPAPVDPAPVVEEEDVTETAATVGSMFSAFQSGVQRGEASTN